MKYLIEIYNPQGERLADISQLCTTRTYSIRRNRPEDIYLTLNLEKAQDLARDIGMGFYQLFAAGINEVRITRDNRPMVGGQLAYVHPRLNQEGATLELRASGFLEMLSKVYLHYGDMLNVWGADMGDIAWSLINNIQAKTGTDFGITEGIIQESDHISENFQNFASSVKEIIIGLSERLDGIDFEFTPDKVFNVYYPGIGTDKTELLFNYPGNITNIGLPQDATTLVNVSINRGQGNGDEVQLVETRTNTDSLATYKRHERIDDYPAVSVAATLQSKGDETLRLYSTPTTIPEVTIDGSMEPFLGSYWIGDRVRFSVDTDRYPAFALLNGQTWRINEITASVDENDHEDISVKVGYS